MKRVFLAGMALGVAALGAQPLPDATNPLQERLTAERARLQAERAQVEQNHEANLRACWQRFAVNDCLIRERRALRQAQAPLKARDLELADQERALREQQRLQRLSARESEAGREP